jgi:hypothetical protein
MTSIDDDR